MGVFFLLPKQKNDSFVGFRQFLLCFFSFAFPISKVIFTTLLCILQVIDYETHCFFILNATVHNNNNNNILTFAILE